MSNSIYDRLKSLYENNPELTFNNDGYQYLPTSVKEANKAAIDEIESLLKEAIQGFVRFDNFKIRKNGDVVVRVQYGWSEFFTGVGYFPLKEFDLLEIEA